MKIGSFEVGGRTSYGAIRDDRIWDLGQLWGDRYPTLRGAIAAGALDTLASASENFALDISGVKLLSPIVDPGKIICVGHNYAAHVKEGGSRETPKHPTIFLRLLNTLVPQGGDLVRPRVSTHFDYEGELAVVIGKPGRHISRETALSHVFGYTIFNDGSVRDYQFDHCLTIGKNFASTGGIGPWIATADEIPDPSRLTITTRLNGEQVQHAGTSDLIVDVPAIIAYVSTFTPLAPGDIIATGTPQGVGFARKPPLWMKAGDKVEVEISGIGTLRNRVVDEA
jgi:2-keto-4-pentenoate hydratase/2-oxohepta-3-ene-1,7-dioic acid hydratase in catechol pathway